MLRVSEIFYSIQGETTTSGFTSVFIRLAGCNLRCSFCDTGRALEGGEEMDIPEVLKWIKSLKPFHHVTLTGGEPLLQEDAFTFLEKLKEAGYDVQVETNGSVLLDRVPHGVRIMADVKTPSSGEAASFKMENIKYLGENDEIKFVISDREDYDFAKTFMAEHLADVKSVVNFSPASGVMSTSELSSLIIRDRLPVRLNLQLHKIGDFQ